ncbi:hypothetical protein CHS0354_039099 [Potamilus streckersoni]|uniref:F5/8 type C domain-containing protein n=1 Tax=Potamilus streckersoni TaxID=2493646 RepID=A0AAE0TJM5_9BIVA|nr:hypothetical protein CHS0354_039099 [Potamilus streckersoni]
MQYSFCEQPAKIECRDSKTHIMYDQVGQAGVTCDTNRGLVCDDRGQFSGICNDYEVRVFCTDACVSTTVTPLPVSDQTPTAKPGILSGATPTPKPGEVSGEIPTAQPEQISGGTPTAKPGILSGGTPTAKPGDVSGEIPTAQPGILSGGTPTAKPGSLGGQTPTAKPGEAFGKTPTALPGILSGGTPTPKPGETSGGTPSAHPEQLSGQTPTAQPGMSSGDTPTPKPGEISGGTPTPEAGKVSGKTPTEQPGILSGGTSTAKPGSYSGQTPTAKPGESNEIPTAQPGMLSGDTPTPKPGELSGGTPTPKPGQALEQTPTAHPEMLSGGTPSVKSEPISGETPTAKPGQASEQTPTAHPESLSGGTPSVEPEPISGETPTAKPGQASEQTPTAHPESLSGGTPSVKPEPISGGTPTAKPEQVSGEIPSAQPGMLSNGTPTPKPGEVSGEIPTVQPGILSGGTPNAQPGALPDGTPTAKPGSLNVEIPTAKPGEVSEETPTAQPGMFSGGTPTARPVQVSGETPTAQPYTCREGWTEWINNDNPVVGLGDIETFHSITSYPAVCDEIITTECVVASTGQRSDGTGQDVKCNINGLECLNSPFQRCLDYKVRFYCGCTNVLTLKPEQLPGNTPTAYPSLMSGETPTAQPGIVPGASPTAQPGILPGQTPTAHPNVMSGEIPTAQPGILPGGSPTAQPEMLPGQTPTAQPGILTGEIPSAQPGIHSGGTPTAEPILLSGQIPTAQPGILSGQTPTAQPGMFPGQTPSAQPGMLSGQSPTAQPGILPGGTPTAKPSPLSGETTTAQPGMLPGQSPTANPGILPGGTPTAKPGALSGETPTAQPGMLPGQSPTGHPGIFTGGAPTVTQNGLTINMVCDHGWTKVMNANSPTDGNDLETFDLLRQKYQFCQEDNIVTIKCILANTGSLYDQSGEEVTCERKTGLTCYGHEQADGKCEDYAVQLYCDCRQSTPTPVTVMVPSTTTPGATTHKICDVPMGLSNPFIVSNNQFDASTAYNYSFEAFRGRLYEVADITGGGAWIPRHADQFQWVQVDFGLPERIVGIITQGRQDMPQWVTTYTVSYSIDGQTWQDYKDVGASVSRLFQGNYDQNTPVIGAFDREILARYVRINPKTWYNTIALRFDMLSCYGPSSQQTTVLPSLFSGHIPTLAPGILPQNSPTAVPNALSGNTPTAVPGMLNGQTPTPAPGSVSGQAPTAAPGSLSEVTPTAAPGPLNGETPTAAPGSISGKTPTAVPGSYSGDTPTPAPGALSGKTPTAAPGAHSGATPTAAPGALSGETPTPAPGALSRETPTTAPGAQNGETPTAAPGSISGQTPTAAPGSVTGGTPTAAPGPISGQTPTVVPGQFPGQTPTIAPVCSEPMGVDNALLVRDSQMTSSSTLDSHSTAAYGRLYNSFGAWSPLVAVGKPWIQVDLLQPKNISGIFTQGSPTDDKWITKFYISTSIDGFSFTLYSYEVGGTPKIFTGNSDRNTVVQNLFNRNVLARHVRIIAVEGAPNGIGLRFNLVGCYSAIPTAVPSVGPKLTPTTAPYMAGTGTPTAVPPMLPQIIPVCQIEMGIGNELIVDTSQLTASSSLDNNHTATGGRMSYSGWIASSKDTRPWIQVDFLEVKTVSGIRTRGSQERPDWVKEYTVYTSINGVDFTPYSDKPGDDKPKVFTGNNDQTTVVSNSFNRNTFARYVRIYPTSIHGAVAVSFEVMGCNPSAPNSAPTPAPSVTPTAAPSMLSGQTPTPAPEIINGETQTAKPLVSGQTPTAAPQPGSKASPTAVPSGGSNTPTLAPPLPSFEAPPLVCLVPMGLENQYIIADSQFNASSFAGPEFNPEYARIYNQRSWAPRTDDKKPWIEVNFGSPKLLSGVITQGEFGSNRWVTQFYVSFSFDGHSFTTYSDTPGDNKPKIFGGNKDESTPVRYLFNRNVTAQYIRIYPVSWTGSTAALRMNILGCNPSKANVPTAAPPSIPSNTPTARPQIGDLKTPTPVPNMWSGDTPTTVPNMLSGGTPTAAPNMLRGETPTAIPPNGGSGIPTATPGMFSGETPTRGHHETVTPADLTIPLSVCDVPMGVENSLIIGDKQLSASSSQDTFHSASRGRLYSEKDGSFAGAWVPQVSNERQWIQVDFLAPYAFAGIITQGRADLPQWVTKYQVFYSNDGQNWVPVPVSYKDSTPRIFTANTDQNTPVTNSFQVVIGRFIRYDFTYLLDSVIRLYCPPKRINPVEWHDGIALRFSVIGCKAPSSVMTTIATVVSTGPGLSPTVVPTPAPTAGPIGTTCAYWTPWSNINTPDDLGEFENVWEMKKMVTMCEPTTIQAIECRTVGTHIPYNQAGETDVICDLNMNGVMCDASKQADGKCMDYEIRVFCDDCSTTLSPIPDQTETPTLAPYACQPKWSDYISHMTPTSDMDYIEHEFMTDIEKKTFCSDGLITRIECETVAGIPMYSSGSVGTTCNVNSGFTCKNSDNFPVPCEDFRVRYYCDCSPGIPTRVPSHDSGFPTRTKPGKTTTQPNPGNVSTVTPTEQLGQTPTAQPGMVSGIIPTAQPGIVPGVTPTAKPVEIPTAQPVAFSGGTPTPKPGQVSGEIPTVEMVLGGTPSAPPGQVSGKIPTAQPGMFSGGLPTPKPGQMPGENPTAHPGQVPGESPTAQPGMFSGGMPTAQPGQMPGESPTAQPGLLSGPTPAPVHGQTGIPTPTPRQLSNATPTAHPLIGGTGTPTAVPNACSTIMKWSNWLNNDRPDTGNGDYESMNAKDLSMFCGSGKIASVECKTTNNIPYYSTGDVMYCDMASGVQCNTADNFPVGCQDYMIRYQCEETICQAPTPQPGKITGETPTAQPGILSGGTPTPKPGMLSGLTPAAHPELLSGGTPTAQPRHMSVDIPTAQPGILLGSKPTAKPGEVSGKTPNAQPGPLSGQTPTAQPGPLSGQTPTAQPGPLSGQTPTVHPDILSDGSPTAQPGQLSRETPTVSPGMLPSKTPTAKPGMLLSGAPMAQPGQLSGSTPTPRPGHETGEIPSAHPQLGLSVPTAVPVATCTQSFWSSWINRDNPSLSDGDYETFTAKELSDFCLNGKVTRIECVTDAGIAHYSSGEQVSCTVQDGLKCSNDDNAPMTCSDYRVRYFCECSSTPTPGQTTTAQPKPVELLNPTIHIQCAWSPWLNSDKPKTDLTDAGDLETIQSLKTKYGLCKSISDIKCRVANSNTPSSASGQSGVTCDIVNGLRCYNKEQVGQICYDYEVSLLCWSPECTTTPTPGPTPYPGATPPLVTMMTAVCPPGESWNVCAYNCDEMCDGFAQRTGMCEGDNKCVPTCKPEGILACSPGLLLKDKRTCVKESMCPCLKQDGTVAQPYETWTNPIDQCSHCLCANNTIQCMKDDSCVPTPTTTLAPEMLSEKTPTPAPYLSPIVHPDCQWTAWINTDRPDTGNGDLETISKIRTLHKLCENPLLIECRDVKTKNDVKASKQTVTCDLTSGLKCLNWDNGGQCDDYEVRFFCPCASTTIVPAHISGQTPLPVPSQISGQLPTAAPGQLLRATPTPTLGQISGQATTEYPRPHFGSTSNHVPGQIIGQSSFPSPDQLIEETPTSTPGQIFGKTPTAVPGQETTPPPTPRLSEPEFINGETPTPAPSQNRGQSPTPAPGQLSGATPTSAPGLISGQTPTAVPGQETTPPPTPRLSEPEFINGETPTPAPSQNRGQSPTPAPGQLSGATPTPAPGLISGQTPTAVPGQETTPPPTATLSEPEFINGKTPTPAPSQNRGQSPTPAPIQLSGATPTSAPGLISGQTPTAVPGQETTPPPTPRLSEPEFINGETPTPAPSQNRGQSPTPAPGQLSGATPTSAPDLISGQTPTAVPGQETTPPPTPRLSEPEFINGETPTPAPSQNRGQSPTPAPGQLSGATPTSAPGLISGQTPTAVPGQETTPPPTPRLSEPEFINGETPTPAPSQNRGQSPTPAPGQLSGATPTSAPGLISGQTPTAVPGQETTPPPTPRLKEPEFINRETPTPAPSQNRGQSPTPAPGQLSGATPTSAPGLISGQTPTAVPGQETTPPPTPRLSEPEFINGETPTPAPSQNRGQSPTPAPGQLSGATPTSAPGLISGQTPTAVPGQETTPPPTPRLSEPEFINGETPTPAPSQNRGQSPTPAPGQLSGATPTSAPGLISGQTPTAVPGQETTPPPTPRLKEPEFINRETPTPAPSQNRGQSPTPAPGQLSGATPTSAPGLISGQTPTAVPGQETTPPPTPRLSEPEFINGETPTPAPSQNRGQSPTPAPGQLSGATPTSAPGLISGQTPTAVPGQETTPPPTPRLSEPEFINGETPTPAPSQNRGQSPTPAPGQLSGATPTPAPGLISGQTPTAVPGQETTPPPTATLSEPEFINGKTPTPAPSQNRGQSPTPAPIQLSGATPIPTPGLISGHVPTAAPGQQGGSEPSPPPGQISDHSPTAAPDHLSGASPTLTPSQVSGHSPTAAPEQHIGSTPTLAPGQVSGQTPVPGPTICGWTPWLNGHKPDEVSGESEMFTDLHTIHSFCNDMDIQSIECREADTYKPISETGQKNVVCDIASGGLMCFNFDQPSGKCLDYEIRVFCEPKGVDCTSRAPGQVTTNSPTPAPYANAHAPTKAPSFLSEATPTMSPSYTGNGEIPTTMNKVPMPITTCADHWSEWINKDSPETGDGDKEASALEYHNLTGFCAMGKITSIECQTKEGISSESYDDVMQCTLDTGADCSNDVNFPMKCQDYKIRYFCAANCASPAPNQQQSPTPAPETGVTALPTKPPYNDGGITPSRAPGQVSTDIPTAVPQSCTSGWSSWINHDNPTSDDKEIENMTPEELQKFCPSGKITRIDCETASGIPHYSSGEILSCTIANGLTCNNSDNFPISCSDYKVKYYCECEATPSAAPSATGMAPTAAPSATGMAPTAAPSATGMSPTAAPSATGMAPTTAPSATGMSLTAAPSATGMAPTAAPSATGMAPTAAPSATGMAPTAVPSVTGMAPTAAPSATGMSPTAVPSATGVTPTAQPTPGTSIPDVCAEIMGMKDGRIRDDMITVSSSRNSAIHPTGARLDSNSAWIAGVNDRNQYIQVNFLAPRLLTGVTTQGRAGIPSFVKTYIVTYSYDGFNWNNYQEVSGIDKVFSGNSDSDSHVTHWFIQPIRAQFLRIIPQSWQGVIAMRLEIHGCYETYPTTAVPPIITGQTPTATPPIMGQGTPSATQAPQLLESCIEWDRWVNEGHLTLTSGGDFELISLVQNMSTLCQIPVKIQCVRASDELPADQTGQVTKCNLWDGFSCSNADQIGGICYEYKVRLGCLKNTPECVPQPTPTKTAQHATTVLTGKSVLPCVDGMDISVCPASCPDGQYCDGVKCVHRSECTCLIDGKVIRPGFFTENKDCATCTCVGGDLRCEPKKCLPCPDGYAQSLNTTTCQCNCKTCATNEFRCGNGQCIPSSLLCDGVIDCIDDEKECGSVKLLTPPSPYRETPTREPVLKFGETPSLPTTSQHHDMVESTTRRPNEITASPTPGPMQMTTVIPTAMPEALTTSNRCRHITCSVPMQPKLKPGEVARIVTIGCCNDYEVFCKSELCSSPVLNCNAPMAIQKVSSEECCPTYNCICPPTCPPMVKLQCAQGSEVVEIQVDCNCTQNACMYSPTPAPTPAPNPVCKYTATKTVVNGTEVPSTNSLEITYNVGDTWSDGLCKYCQCNQGSDGHSEILCHTNTCPACKVGEHRVPHVGKCCGECQAIGCLVEGKVYMNGEEIVSSRNCYNKRCVYDVFLRNFLISETHVECGRIDVLPPCQRNETSYDATGCCMKCVPASLLPAHSNASSTCSECTPRLVFGQPQRSVGYFRVSDNGELCQNLDVIADLKECSGYCGSQSSYTSLMQGFNSMCQCCRPTTTITKTIKLACTSGRTISKTYSVPESCGCGVCT